jgi:ABC-type phosphate transport system permease subunit
MARSVTLVEGASGRAWRPPAATRGRVGRIGDPLFRALLKGSAWLVILLAIGLVIALAWESSGAVRAFGLRFIVTSTWDPVAGDFGALPFIYGTLVSSLLALLLAVPLSLGAAIYLAELAPAWVRPPVAFLIEMLAAVPSVVYGLWGIFVLVPWLRDWVQPSLGRWLGFLPLFSGPAYGVGMLAAGAHPLDHGRAVHHLGGPRGAARRAERAAGGGARAGSHALGSHPHRGAALRA